MAVQSSQLQRLVSSGYGAPGRRPHDGLGLRRERRAFRGVVEAHRRPATGRRGNCWGGLSHRKSRDHSDHVRARSRAGTWCAVGSRFERQHVTAGLTVRAGRSCSGRALVPLPNRRRWLRPTSRKQVVDR